MKKRYVIIISIVILVLFYAKTLIIKRAEAEKAKIEQLKTHQK